MRRRDFAVRHRPGRHQPHNQQPQRGRHLRAVAGEIPIRRAADQQRVGDLRLVVRDQLGRVAQVGQVVARPGRLHINAAEEHFTVPLGLRVVFRRQHRPVWAAPDGEIVPVDKPDLRQHHARAGLVGRQRLGFQRIAALRVRVAFEGALRGLAGDPLQGDAGEEVAPPGRFAALRAALRRDELAHRGRQPPGTRCEPRLAPLLNVQDDQAHAAIAPRAFALSASRSFGLTVAW